MVSKMKIRWINSLSRKKIRDEEGIFVAEGKKIVADLLPLLPCRFVASTDKDWSDKYRKYFDEIDEISEEEYRKITFQKSPQGVLAIFEKPVFKIDLDVVAQNLSIALDDIQDPGNLGTIVRLANWFGIDDVFCSMNTVDIYNPKTIQATMGAVGCVRIHYVDLEKFLSKASSKVPIYGTFMDSENIFSENLTENGIIVMGNEGNGISEKLMPFIDRKLTIPSFPYNITTSESLNVGLAAAITVAEFRRKNSKM
ncbi:MAG: RNA methyltransferase [Paludibacteraceae bacterium]